MVMVFPPSIRMPRVCTRLSVVRRRLRNASYTAPHLPAEKPSCQPPKHSKASSLSQAQLEPEGLVYQTGVLECSGPWSRHVGMVSSVLGPEGGPKVWPTFVVSPMKNN